MHIYAWGGGVFNPLWQLLGWISWVPFGPQGELLQGWAPGFGEAGWTGSLQGLPKLGEAGDQGARDKGPLRSSGRGCALRK